MVWVLHGSQEWDGKGVWVFLMVPKSGVGMKHENGFWRFSWFPRVGWEKLGKTQNEA